MGRTRDFIDRLFKEDGVPCLEFTGKCQDCQEPVSVVIFASDRDNPEGNGGMIVGHDDLEPPMFKCSKCLDRDGNMISFTRPEIFTRVCGYLRPVKGFNPGKKAEWKDRTFYDNTKSIKNAKEE